MFSITRELKRRLFEKHFRVIRFDKKGFEPSFEVQQLGLFGWGTIHIRCTEKDAIETMERDVAWANPTNCTLVKEV